jgi:hypothetical protein
VDVEGLVSEARRAVAERRRAHLLQRDGGPTDRGPS